MVNLSSSSPGGDATEVERLIADARRGDLGARWDAVEACGRYLRVVARRSRGSRSEGDPDISDLVQSTIIAGWRCFPNFEGRTPGQLRAWLRIILLRSMSRAARRRGPVRVEMGGGSDELIDDVTPAGDLAERRESYEAAASAMRRLPEHYRMAIRLRLWEGLAFTDLGERLGLSEDSARKLFGRAVLRVRDLMRAGRERTEDD